MISFLPTTIHFVINLLHCRSKWMRSVLKCKNLMEAAEYIP